MNNPQQQARKELEAILEEGIGFKIGEWQDSAGATIMAIRVLLDGTVMITGDEFDWQPSHFWDAEYKTVRSLTDGSEFVLAEADRQRIIKAIAIDDQKDHESKEILKND